MTTKVEKTIEVDQPVSTVYNQWTQFEEFPQFMGGVKQVQQLDDKRLHWVAEIAGVKREWDAQILEQVPDQKIAWAATEGATNAGAVYFTPVGAGRTSVRLSLEYEPEGLVEKAGDALNIVEKRAEADLEKFKSFIESEGYASGAWRGSINEGATMGTPGVEHAAETVGDKGKAGLSAKTVVGAVGAAAGAAIVANKMKSGGNETDVETTDYQSTDMTTTPAYVEVTEVDVVDVDADATTPYPADSGTDTTYGMGSEATRDNEGMNR
jgi:uncharacterized protein YndB with AHSA1/START domain